MDAHDKLILIDELATLRNLGQKSAAQLVEAGITSVDDFMSRDPISLFEALDELLPASRNFLKAIVGAQRDIDWRFVEVDKDLNWKILTEDN